MLFVFSAEATDVTSIAGKQKVLKLCFLQSPPAQIANFPRRNCADTEHYERSSTFTLQLRD